MAQQYIVRGDLDYVRGYLRYGIKEMILNEEEYEEFSKMTREEQMEWLDDEGEVEILDYSLEDYGDVTSVEVKEVVK